MYSLVSNRARFLRLVLLGGLASSRLAAAEPLPVDYFLTPPTYRLPKLAPDGRSYSIVVQKGNSDALTTVDLATGKAELVTGSSELRLVNYWWKRDDLLLLLLEDRKGFREFQSYDVKTRRTGLAGALRRSYVQLVNPLPDDPENVLVCTGEATGVDIRKFNLRTGRSTSLPVDSGYMIAWFTNQQGQLLAGLGQFHQRWFQIFPAGDNRPWRRVELGEKNTPDFRPIIASADQRRLVGIQYDAADTAGVAAWDPVNDQKETLWQSDEVDVDALEASGDDWSATMAIRFETDRPRLYYPDPADQALTREFDTVLADNFNRIVSTSSDKSKMIVFSSSDRVVGDFYLYDRGRKRLSRLGSTHQNPEPGRLASSRHFVCQVRNELTLHGRIHLPPAAAGRPPAVLVVTDPGVRSRYAYAPFLQLLASRGYAVIQIDHRGKAGFGRKFAEAGNGAVAAMADDIAAGLDWLARESLIDPDRVAVLGQNTGGLVAMQLLARHPRRFKAWVNFWTPMDMGKVDLDEFTFGRLSKTEIKERLGDERTRRNYIRGLDPLPLLPGLKLASFHYYPRQPLGKILINDGVILEKYFAQAGAPEVFLTQGAIPKAAEYFQDRENKDREELAAVYTRLLDFLGKHL